MHRATVGSYRGGESYERGTPVGSQPLLRLTPAPAEGPRGCPLHCVPGKPRSSEKNETTAPRSPLPLEQGAPKLFSLLVDKGGAIKCVRGVRGAQG